MRLIAGLTFVALVFILVQTLLRQAYLERGDDGVLRALGMERAELAFVGVVRAACIGLVAAVVATVVAIGISPLMPIGLARTAELHPGVNVDLLVLGLGFAATLAGVLAVGALAAWRASAPPRVTAVDADRPPWIARAMQRTRVPPTTTVGVQFALDPGRGTTAVPVWTGLLGVALSVVLLTGAWSFRSSLRHLVNTPHLYGWNWDAKTGAPALPDIGGVLIPAFERDRDITDLSAGTVVQVQIQHERVDALALDQQHGTVTPTLLEGRLAHNAHEIVLGTRTMDHLGRSVGDDVTVVEGTVTSRMHVVGRAVFPEYGDAGELGTGALMTYGGMQNLLPTARRNVFLLRFAPGVDRNAFFARLRSALAPVPTRTSGRPPDLEDLANIAGLPALLAAVLAALGRRHARPHARDIGAAAPARPRRAQDARVPPASGLTGGRVADDDTGRGRTRDRYPARGAARALGVDGVRRQPRRGRRAPGPPGADPARDPGRGPVRQRRRRGPGLARRPHPPRHHPPQRVTTRSEREAVRIGRRWRLRCCGTRARR